MEELFGGVGGGGAAKVSLSGNNTSGTKTLISTGTLYLAGGNNITISQDGNSLTVSGANNTGATTFQAGVSTLGNTLGVTGTQNNQLVLAGGSNVTLSQSVNGGSVTVTVLGNAPFSGGVSSGGNTAGDTKTVSNQIVFVGGNNITLSQGTAAGGATVTISGPNVAGAQTGISSIVASDATYTSGQVIFTGAGAVTVSSGANQSVIINAPVQSLQTASRFNLTLAGSTSGALADISSGVMTLAGGNNIVLSQNGNAVTVSAVNSGIVAAISGNTSGALATVSSGTLMLFGGNNITLSQSSHSVTISAANAGGAQTGISGVSVSDTVYTSGTVKITGSNNITVVSGTGQQIIISGPSGGGAGMASSGNYSGTAGTVGAELYFVGGSNISLSQSVNSNSATLTINGASGGGMKVGVSSIGNTSGETGTFSNQVVFAGGNNITLSGATNSNGVTYTISGANVGGAQTGISGIVGSDTTYTSGTVHFIGNGIVTVKSGTGQSIVIDAAGGAFSAGMGGSGNTGGTIGTVTGELYFVGGSNISLSQSINGGSATITIDGASGGGGGATLGVSSLGNTAGTTGIVPGEVVFVGGSNISLSQSINASSATITINGLTIPAFSAGVSTLGNSSGDTGTYANGMVLAGGNNITLSQATNASGFTITVSGPNTHAQQTGISGVSISDNLYTSGTVTYIGSNIVTVKSGNSGQAVVIDATVAAQTVQTYNVVSAAGNTAGTMTSFSTGTIVFAGGSNITLSQSSNTITIKAADGGGGATVSQWMPGGVGASSFTQIGQGSLVVFPAPIFQNGSFSRLDVYGSVSVSTSSNSSYQGTLTIRAGIYTRNASTLSLASSGSVTHTWNGTGSTSSGSLVGMRNFTMPLNASMTPGEYFIGVVSSTNSTNANWVTLSNLALVGFPNAFSGAFGAATNASNQLQAGAGVYSATSNGMPSSIAFSDLVATSASTARPLVNLMNYTA